MTDVSSDPTAASLDGLKTAHSYVTGRLDERIKQRDRLDTRTTLVIATTGALITVLGVVVALFVKEGVRISAALTITIAAAASLLLIAVLIALASLFITGSAFREMKKKDQPILEKFAGCETDTDATAAILIARRASCEWIAFLDRECDKRAWFLFAAHVSQFLGVIGLAITIVMFALAP